MQAFEELKKKIRDIETQSLAMDGCSPSFSVNDILSIIDSVGKDIDVTTTDTVSRQAAIDALRKLSREDGYIDMPHEYVTDAVRALPSAQPEIIRCKDCLFSKERGCAIWCRAWNRYTAHAGWCYQGKERQKE